MPPVVGHRGAAGHAPENTLASVRAAAELGATWVEFDTKLSRDHQAIVFHDHKLDRTTDGRGKVAATDWAEIARLDAGSWFHGDFRGEPVPTLRQALAVVARLGLGANIEIKPSPGLEAESGRVIAGVLAAEWPSALPSPVISSSKVEALAAARERAPAIPRALVAFRLPRRWRDRLAGAGCEALHLRERAISARRVARIRDAGYALRAFTVNDAARAGTLFRWGVETVISDFPDRILPVGAAFTSR
jgi:glycerophosphoryl diester phosphodiesterase